MSRPMSSIRTVASLTLVLLFARMAGAQTPSAIPSPAAIQSGLNLSNLDRAVKPGDDFYQFAVGGWQKTHPIPPEYPEWSTFNQLVEENTLRLRGILEDLCTRGKAAPGSNERKLGDFYASGMNEAAIEKAGVAPIQPELARIAGLVSSLDIEREVARLHSYGVDVFFSFGSDQDARDSSQVIGEINQGGLGLPDRDYYLKTDAHAQQIQKAYRRHIARLLELSGESPRQSAADAQVVYAVEKRLAVGSRSHAALRDPQTNYHRMHVDGLARVAPAFPWSAYLRDCGLSTRIPINLGQPDYLAALNKILRSAPRHDTQAYLRWQLLNATARYLSPAWVDEDFQFRVKTLTGAQVNRPRWKRIVAEVDHDMGEALGRLYVKKYFPKPAKVRALAMISNVRTALRDDLAHLPWMSEVTRQHAVAKLDAFTLKIGYPDRWRDYSALHIDRGLLVSNVLRARQFNFQFDLHKIGRPLDRTQWDMTPSTVNAYYNPAMNEIVFPAGILQPPFFDANAEDAVDYGGIGAVIGHEMTHGFDDQGAQYDVKGSLRDWWTKEDMQRFKSLTHLIQHEYSGFSIAPNVHENGELVTGESLADLGGLTLSYRAYEKSLEGRPRPPDVDGFTPEQRFFLAFAQIWATNLRPEFARLLITTDVHPLPRFRVNGTVSNMPAFAKAWNLKPGDPMVLPPDQRTQIW